MRPALLAGFRVMRFVRARGFNTLTALEDLPVGVQFGGLVGRGIRTWGASDLYLGGAIYAGYATESWWLALGAEADARRDYGSGAWEDMISSGRLAWYRKLSPNQTLIITDEYAGAVRERLPLQLSLGQTEGGIRGYRGSLFIGDRRNVIRAEDRWVLGSPFHRVDVGFAGFVDAGTVGAGASPYGQGVGLRASVGASVLGAFPTGAKRVVRLDIAVPTARDGNRRWEVRMAVENRVGRFWQEPGDVTRTRTGPEPSSVFVWPTK